MSNSDCLKIVLMKANTYSVLTLPKYFKILLLLATFTFFLANATVSRTGNACYQCLLSHENKYCVIDGSVKCCTSGDTDDVCVNGVCISPYNGP